MVDGDLVVPDPSLSLREGAIAAWSRSLTLERAERLGIDMKQSPLEVASAADLVSVHVALNNDTRNLIDEKFFNAMQPGSYFINTSRAEVVDQSALLGAVRERAIRAGLDVFAAEPRVPEALFKLDNVVLQPHVSSGTRWTRSAMGQLVVDNLAAYFADRPLLTQV